MLTYLGRSKLDRVSPIMVTAATRPRNKKTGSMIGFHILPRLSVASAVRPHASVCPSGCPFAPGGEAPGGCMVNWATGPRATQLANDGAEIATPEQLARVLRGRGARLGQEGDPAAVRAAHWDRVTSYAEFHTGYTHHWRERSAGYLARLVMASVESPDQAEHAADLGFRWFRIRPRGSALLSHEIQCPAVNGSGVTCGDCRMCDGHARTHSRARALPSISIEAHGGAVAAKVANRHAVAV